MITLPKLPYAEDALAPHISAETVRYHYHKHHKGYVDKLNKALAAEDSPFPPSTSLKTLIEESEGKLYNLAAQVWNHNFYWRCMTPMGGGEAPPAVEKALSERFGSAKKFLEELKSCATAEFGSGWAWLVRNAQGELDVLSTTDAQNPMTDNCTPLLVMDVWEHAYYLDYQNERGRYVDAFCEHLIDWDFLAENLFDQDQAVARAG